MTTVLLAAISVVTLPAAERPTARRVSAEIQKQTGVEWRTQTVDTFKHGFPF